MCLILHICRDVIVFYSNKEYVINLFKHFSTLRIMGEDLCVCKACENPHRWRKLDAAYLANDLVACIMLSGQHRTMPINSTRYRFELQNCMYVEFT